MEGAEATKKFEGKARIRMLVEVRMDLVESLAVFVNTGLDRYKMPFSCRLEHGSRAEMD